ncbi:MAG: hypothetical protein A3F67_10205 [Verrucomicrobia bacterium RIFCSPHIGHO2_12_FULL_41_10]|nr:MAG: hypothetical protein A3F67_10205 [Verrucomicrobia bacterium RIFCSPHIGHO2_12_FULL_41_10]HLB33935.1 3'-5' exonuclease [Chthoniobacterales bacterium]
MSHLLLKNTLLAAIDFESAGEQRGEAAIPIQVGIAEMKNLQLNPSSFYRSYLQSERSVTWSAQQVHGISDDDLKDAPSLLSLWPEFQQRLSKRILVAHGRGTERRFLRAFPMHGFGPWIDTLTLSRKLLPGLSSYSLSDLIVQCNLYKTLDTLLPGFRFHEALSDALASLVLLQHLIEEADLAHRPVELLLAD